MPAVVTKQSRGVTGRGKTAAQLTTIASATTTQTTPTTPTTTRTTTRTTTQTATTPIATVQTIPTTSRQFLFTYLTPPDVSTYTGPSEQTAPIY